MDLELMVMVMVLVMVIVMVMVMSKQIKSLVKGFQSTEIEDVRS